MNDPTPARQRHGAERVQRMADWLRDHAAVLCCEKGRVWFEWEREDIKAGFEMASIGRVPQGLGE